MAAFYPLCRLGTELVRMPLYALDMLVKHSPDGDPWLRGETLDVIIKRIALLSERDYDEVKSEVKTILKEKHEKEVQRLNDEAQAALFSGVNAVLA